ncbi:MAG: YdiU family protein [Betaproteobacteria bacterium]|nr:YdiU family protein [Betaproteobacteria bacterium]MDH5342656.1 YdiU family protein [Betaproteobacteria bacterium]
MSAPAVTVNTDFSFDNTYARDLEGLYVPWQAAEVPAPKLIKLNHALAEELGLDAKALDSAEGAQMFSGNQLPHGIKTIAQAYAGHQFGGFSPQLGDGRALLLGEVIDKNGKRRDIAFKGSGRTPFSRGGDGKAALGPVLREYIIGEAMHALGIPTTRALAAVTTGEFVRRERNLPGAVLTRVAASHIRVGTFQFVTARGDEVLLRKLADYVIARHYPELKDSDDPYWGLLRALCERQAALIARWMNVGFIHGVMNTDNMTLSGETIDYGPCAFMDHYNPATVFSSIDEQGRYAYMNQPPIANWNLARFAEALLPLLGEDQDQAVAQAMEILGGFQARYEHHWLQGMRLKLGLTREEDDDYALATDFLKTMEGQSVDFTQAFRRLADVAGGQGNLSEIGLHKLYADDAVLKAWLPRWRARIEAEAVEPAKRAQAMRAVNPIYVPRNHKVEEALDAAVALGNYAPFEQLLAVLQRPFEERAALAAYAEPAPASVSAGYQTFCGT